MDDNKLKLLREKPYSIPKTCHFCIHATFSRGAVWSTCDMANYEHLKHSDKVRQLSISRFGSCPDWDGDPAVIDELGAFTEFLDNGDS